ncbi:MAG TPA: endonuclease domain-containing protein [Stellaceae bacterium]|nr:endonuclease domain-containing protein [Stellaceae bacterium]
MWSVLRNRNLNRYKFRRQRPVGPYILDFACLAYRVAIEADGGQHADSESDARRTAWLERHGWCVLRFWNNDILANTEGVAETIVQTMGRLSVNPRPPSASRWAPPSPAERERG